MTYNNTPEYRFAPPGSRDEPPTVAECAWCGREIYAGDEVARSVDDDVMHDGCMAEYLRAYYVTYRGVIGADGTIE